MTQMFKISTNVYQSAFFRNIFFFLIVFMYRFFDIEDVIVIDSQRNLTRFVFTIGGVVTWRKGIRICDLSYFENLAVFFRINGFYCFVVKAFESTDD